MLRFEIAEIPDWAPVINTMPQASAKTTIVRIAVARFEFTPSMPILAKMEVMKMFQISRNMSPSASKKIIC